MRSSNTSGSKATSVDDHISPATSLPSPPNGDETVSPKRQPLTAGGSEDSRKVWTKDRFKKIAVKCREQGRVLKHAGDKRMRDYHSGSKGPKEPILALLEQVDAVILYAYAFWCEDQMSGSLRNLPTSSKASDSKGKEAMPSSWEAGCAAQNWKSIFGLVQFVRQRADKLAQSLPPGTPAHAVQELQQAMHVISAWTYVARASLPSPMCIC